MKDYILEICVDSVESAIAAAEGGADRLELCSNLIIGGTTPGPWLFEEIRKRSDIRIHALIRPRFGDFCYTDAEFSMIRNAVKDFRKMGAEGVVVGILKPDGTLNMEQMKELMDAAGDMSVTLHRAFDVCADPIEAMEQAISLGIDTILTSGQKNTCLQGAELLKELETRSQGRITIQAGSGVGAEVIRQLYPLTGIKAYHMSGKVVTDSAMQFRKEGVNMGLPTFSEYEIWRTDIEKCSCCKESSGGIIMAEGKIFLKENRDRIEKKYREQMMGLPQVFAEIDKKLAECTDEVALACKYLYAFMPYSDIGNYAFEVFLDYAENGVYLWKENSGVAELPEEIFLNYVLFHRVNEEEIAPCRTFFRREIGERTGGMSFREAALEVNYWCAQEATYHCTDDRTLSALAVYRRGNGRCGEESVFTVNALRSVGVPARQVYAPKWSHCDDNHAWVEIWCDGSWYFLGACEPEEILNKGWFTNASSRAMMVHSRVFDTMIPEGEVIGKDGMVTMLNELKRYALTKEITVSVKDSHGKPAEGAEVSFEVLNYSEYAPIAELKTDSLGKVCLTTGLGSIHISARMYADGEWLHAENSMDTKTEDCCEICLMPVGKEKGIFYEEWTEIDMIAPHDAPVNKDMPTPEQKERGSRRLAEANAYREQKVRNLSNPECRKFLEKKLEILQ